jgi:hypothetical protein
MVSLNHLDGRTSGISLSVLTKVLNEVLPNAKDSGIKIPFSPKIKVF